MPVNPIEFTKQLIARASVTPDDSGCQRLIADELNSAGFHCEFLQFGDVTNLWATHGKGAPVLAFAGHTDVVPPGPLSAWTTPPFQPDIREGYLYGRGAADMKSGLAAMVSACQYFLQKKPSHAGTIAFLITSDEEGPSVNGTKKVVELLKTRQQTIDWCIIGEPTSKNILGDTVKNGRRGSLNGTLVIQGKQGHIAYPHLSINPIHLAMPFLNELIAIKWDNGNDFFQPTALQISNIQAGTGATNVIPDTLQVQFNFRFSPEITEKLLRAKVEELLRNHQLNYRLDWHLSGQPFLTKPGKLLDAVTIAVKEIMQINPELSTSGGTSDGRFIATMNTEVIELGTCNATSHKIDEHVSLDELEKLTLIYEKILHLLF